MCMQPALFTPPHETLKDNEADIMKTGEHTNEHGVRVTEHICETCGVEFTICPGIDDYPDCLDIDCDSYDPDCEVDLENIKPAGGPRQIIH